jgi:hypothetical protein
MNINPDDCVFEQIRAAEVKAGYSLAIPVEGQAEKYQLFQVAAMGWEWTAEKQTITLTSEPVDGEPWVLKLPPGQLVFRVTRRRAS